MMMDVVVEKAALTEGVALETSTGITRLGSVPIFVRDQDQALAFYRNQLGFEVLMDIPIGGGKRWISVVRQRGETELILFHPASYSGNSERTEALEQRVGIWTGIVFHTDDIEAAYHALRGRSVIFSGPPKRQPWGGWEAYFSDPDGNQFHLTQRPSGMPS